MRKFILTIDLIYSDYQKNQNLQGNQKTSPNTLDFSYTDGFERRKRIIKGIISQQKNIFAGSKREAVGPEKL